MAEQRYSFRFSLVELGVLGVSVVAASLCVFLFGTYVGRGVEARRVVQQTQPVRMAATVSTSPAPPPPALAPLAWQLAQRGRPPVGEPPRWGDKAVSDGRVKSISPPLESEGTAQVQSTPTDAATPPPRTATAQRKKATDTDRREYSAAIARAKSAGAEPPRAVSDASLREREGKAASSRLGASASAGVKERPATVLRSGKDGVVIVHEESVVASPGVLPSTTPVRVVKASAPVRRQPKRWKVQIEATTQEVQAQDVARMLRGQGYASTVSRVVRDGEVLYRVRVGEFASQQEARTAMAHFRREGKPQAFLVSE